MRILTLSDAATKLLETRFPGKVLSVLPEELASELCAARTSAVVVGELASIDNRLADSIHAAESLGISVGVVPYDIRYHEALWRLLGPGHAIKRDAAVIGLYSSRGLRYDFRDPPYAVPGNLVRLQRKFDQEGRRDTEDASYRITAHDFTALAIVTEGRQTYCLLGMGCLHPTISEPKMGQLAPPDVNARHWLLQSCHSPFVWPELGSYLTVPLSIALTGNAETVICSTHVQTYIPGLLNVYLEKLSRGCALGEVVRALNKHAASEGVDHRPFILLGNPESKAIDPHIVSVTDIPTSNLISSNQSKNQTELLRRLIANVEFLFDQKHFGFDNKENNTLFEFRRDLAWLPRVDMRSLSPFMDWTQDVEIFLDKVRPPNVTVSLVHATRHLSTAFERQGGFYAVGEKLDENYSPDGASQTSDRCLVCDERLIERRLRYLGQSRSDEYSMRSQKLCPRCLVVEHVSPVHRGSTQVTAERIADELRIALSYTNSSTEPQWVFAFAFLADPNNVSRSTAPKEYRALLKTIRCRRNQERPRSLMPGKTYNFSFRTGSIPTDFWCLLIEINLMVDFCWNWFSVTYRAKEIENWLSSARYRRTLPPRVRDRT